MNKVVSKLFQRALIFIVTDLSIKYSIICLSCISSHECACRPNSWS